MIQTEAVKALVLKLISGMPTSLTMLVSILPCLVRNSPANAHGRANHRLGEAHLQLRSLL